MDVVDARRSLAPVMIVGAVLLSVIGLFGHHVTDVTRMHGRTSSPRAMVPDRYGRKDRGGDGADAAAVPVLTRNVADLEVEESWVGWGTLGLGADLGFEGLKLNHNGQQYFHGVSMHATPHGTAPAFARFKIPDPDADAAQAKGKKTKTLFSSVVAINDNNNRRGMAGSPLTFSVRGPDGTVLWQSKPLIQTMTEDVAVDIDVSGYDTITLQVEAAGNNHCTHAVWVDPVLRS